MNDGNANEYIARPSWPGMGQDDQRFRTKMVRLCGSGVVVAGFGSPHGDDRAGWEVAERLMVRAPLCAAAKRGDVAAERVRVVRVREGTQLIHELEGCGRLIVVDACHGSGPVGTISRFRWPDARIRRHHDRSTHEIGLYSALELAKQLGKLPPEVVVFGIEIGDDEPVGGVSGEVLRAVDELEAVIVAEIETVLPRPRGEGSHEVTYA